jgi:hypothetical protein
VSSALPVGTLVHYVIEEHPAQANNLLYMNGNLVALQSTSSTGYTATNEADFLRMKVGSSSENVMVHSFAVYDRALDQAEVTALFIAGSPKALPVFIETVVLEGKEDETVVLSPASLADYVSTTTDFTKIELIGVTPGDLVPSAPLGIGETFSLVPAENVWTYDNATEICDSGKSYAEYNISAMADGCEIVAGTNACQIQSTLIVCLTSVDDQVAFTNTVSVVEVWPHIFTSASGLVVNDVDIVKRPLDLSLTLSEGDTGAGKAQNSVVRYIGGLTESSFDSAAACLFDSDGCSSVDVSVVSVTANSSLINGLFSGLELASVAQGDVIVKAAISEPTFSLGAYTVSTAITTAGRGAPTAPPTKAPSSTPTTEPTQSPSSPPTKAPTGTPSRSPTNAPTAPPTKAPSKAPSTESPSKNPTMTPSLSPSESPTATPTSAPTRAPTAPTMVPTVSPTYNPTYSPTVSPSDSPTPKAKPSLIVGFQPAAFVAMVTSPLMLLAAGVTAWYVWNRRGKKGSTHDKHGPTKVPSKVSSFAGEPEVGFYDQA